jgi:hypothetical protein
MTILIIILIASAFVCGAEVQKYKNKWFNRLCLRSNKNLSERLSQCESALIKQTNEYQNNFTAGRRTKVAPREKHQDLGGLQNCQSHRIRVREGV